MWKILIIDDDEDDFTLAQSMLKEARGRRFEVHWAKTYAEGQNELFSNHYHAVLVDYDLGLYSGIELIREANQRGYASPLILFTGRGNYEVDVEAMAAGATLYLTKAEANPLLLERAIRYAIEMKQKEQTLHEHDARLRSALESTHDMVILLDRDWRFQYVNRRYAESFSQNAEDFVGKHLFEVFPRYKDSSLEQHYRKAMEERVPVHFEMESVYRDAWYVISAYPTQEGISVFIQERTDEKRALDALRLSRERLERAQEIAHLGSWELDTIHNKLTWSDEVYRIFGMQPQEFEATYEAFLDRIHPEDREAVDAAYTSSLRENRDTYEIDHRVVRKSTGEIRFVHEKCEHFRDATGQIIRSVGMVHDVTDRMLVEAGLREHEQKLLALFENSTDAVFLMKPDGSIEAANPAASALFGWSELELCGMGRSGILDTRDPALAPALEDRRRIGHIKRRELTALHKSGARFPVEVDSVILPTEPVRSFVIMRDITDRKRHETAIREHEAQLRESQEKLSEILKSIEDGFFAIDRNWRYTFVNRQAAQTADREPEEMVGQNIWELFPFLENSVVGANYRKGMEERVPVHFIADEIIKNRFFEVSVYPSQDGISVFYRDKTEQLLAEKALLESDDFRRKSEAQAQSSLQELQNIYANSPIGLFYLDLDLRYQAVNDRLARINGLPAEEHIGKTIQEVLSPPVVRLVEPLLRQVLATGEPELTREINGELSHTKGQTSYWLVSFYPLKGEDGRVIGVSAVMEDITERKQTEERLRSNEERFRLMGETLPYGVWLCDAEGKALYTSQSFLDLLEMTMEEMQGFGWTHRLPPEEVAPMLERWMHSIHTGEDWDDEHHVLGPDGKYHTVLTRGKPVRDANGTITFWVGINLDIDKRKKMEEALKQANMALKDFAEKLNNSNKELEEFAFIASHDLNEPLRKIKLFGNSLRKALGGNLPSDAEDYLNRIQGATDRMSKMVSGLLDLSRVNTQGEKFQPIPLSRIVEEVVSDLEVSLQTTGGKVIIEELPTADVDAFQFRQLFQNLIANAIKFHKPDVSPIVKVRGSLVRTGSVPNVMVTVEDNGIGFDETYADQIFKPFMRLNSRTEFEGTGMGLAICKKIVERHHGTIEVESAPGEGTTFIIHFPLQPSS